MKMSLCVSVLCCATSYSLMVQAACMQPPSCEELGFTVDASKCSGAALKCPWDLSKAACKEKEEIEIGSILYGDGTVASGIVTGKTPIGVVFDTANRLAVALTDVKEDGTAGSETMYWSSDYCYTPGLQNCTTTEIPTGTNLTPITCGVDGRLNTNAILASTCNGTIYAATATNNYQPAGCTKDFCKKSKWFLPSLRDLQNIYLQRTQIDASLTLLKAYSATTLRNEYYWSSTGDYNYAWKFGMYDGYRASNGKSGSTGDVRPVLAF